MLTRIPRLHWAHWVGIANLVWGLGWLIYKVGTGRYTTTAGVYAVIATITSCIAFAWAWNAGRHAAS